MSGLELTKFLRSHAPTRDLPVILVTASRVETSDIVEGLGAGANDYVARPFAPQELRARIEAALRQKQLSDLAELERQRLAAINRLGRALFVAGGDIAKMVDELADVVTSTMSDGCAISFLPGDLPPIAVAKHPTDPAELQIIAALADPAIYAFGSSQEALSSMPPQYHAYIRRFGLRGLAILPLPIFAPIQGVVTVTRDGRSAPFSPDDLSAIETCIEYTALAIQNAIRGHERERFAHFQQELLGIVGHDLRNPLGAIVAGIEMLRLRGAGRPEIVTVVEKLDTSATRMTRIVDQLLDVTRARLGGGISLDLGRASLRSIVKTVIDELAIAKPKSQFVLRCERDVEGVWDRDRLSQAVSNLLGNAVAYGKAGAPIEIAIVRGDHEVTLAVKNELRDMPIPPQQLAVLFDPYRRGAEGRRHSAGLGLGLYIVQEIVRAHHGSITVTSDESGTVFVIHLPVDPTVGEHAPIGAGR